MSLMARLRLALLVVSASALGCRARQVGMGPNGSVRLGPAPVLTCKPDPQFRWLDALDHPYSEAFRKRFSYKKAHVVVSLAKASPTFQGRLKARKLKPNFAYQMKLVGMPSFLWPQKNDDAANRRLGERGRWWRPGDTGGNVYFYWEEKAEQEAEKEKMEGYLLFGYFVTDANGGADVAFRLDSSLHVLWKTSQWPPAKEDAKPTRHPIVAEAGSYGYDRSFEPGHLEVYAEAERDRPPVGTVKLPPGRYRCFFLLTEETFHAWGAGHGGEWAAALAAPIEFIITQGAAENAPATQEDEK